MLFLFYALNESKIDLNRRRMPAPTHVAIEMSNNERPNETTQSETMSARAAHIKRITKWLQFGMLALIFLIIIYRLIVPETKIEGDKGSNTDAILNQLLRLFQTVNFGAVQGPNIGAVRSQANDALTSFITSTIEATTDSTD